MKTRTLLFLIVFCFPGLAIGMEPDPINVDEILAHLTLRQKVGQMMIMGFEGTRVTADAMARINDDCLGGYFVQILENFNFPDELATLSYALQDAALNNGAKIPLFISMDQEGGVAAPLNPYLGATPTPGNMALGASGRAEDAYAAYQAMGSDMRACGANVNFAPAIDVLKVPTNPDYTIRSFSGDVGRNAVLAAAAVKGLQAEGVIATAKHFPGLISYNQDLHSDISHLPETEAEIKNGALAHFRAAIDAGTDMIMTDHVFLDCVDTSLPVTLSPKVLMDLLREQLGYQNLIVTDSMGMGAISKYYGNAEAAALSVIAGCDIVLQVSRSVEELHVRMDGILDAVKQGRLTEQRINESVRRILTAKAKYRLFSNSKPDDAAVRKGFIRPELLEANRRAAADGIVLVRDEAHLLPLPKQGKKICVICTPSAVVRPGKNGEALPMGHPLGHFIRAKVPAITEVRVGTIPTEALADYAISKAEQADIIVCASLLAMQSPEQVAFIKRVLALGKPTVVVGLGDPSDMSLFPEVKTFLAANSPASICLEAATNVLFGDAEPMGTLPMPIGDLYPVGYAYTPSQ
ncbi:MAG TPA: glycoside hydrolase family 3 protein [Candidatus Hydrogenedentes bacterium]|nr:glycoside hydrolase family 3 protein [Candidatus Hydrogenedentota bacterium]